MQKGLKMTSDIIPDQPDLLCKKCGNLTSKLFNIQEKRFVGWWCHTCFGGAETIIKPIGREKKFEFTGKDK